MKALGCPVRQRILQKLTRSEGDSLKDLGTTADWSALNLDDEAFTELNRMVANLM